MVYGRIFDHICALTLTIAGCDISDVYGVLLPVPVEMIVLERKHVGLICQAASINRRL